MDKGFQREIAELDRANRGLERAVSDLRSAIDEFLRPPALPEDYWGEDEA